MLCAPASSAETASVERRAAKALAAAAVVLALAGCAGMSEQACLTSDWRTVGFEDGSLGRSEATIGNYRKACAEHGVSPDLDAYRSGHADGVKTYCRPGNGFEVGHSGGVCSITGGGVYRGCQMPGFFGAYFYGDYCAGFVKSFRMAGGLLTDPRDWTEAVAPGGALVNSLTSFGQDAQGEIYITDRDGTVLRIVPPFADLEVSGTGAASPFRLDADAWRWEELEASTMHPVDHYRVYRGLPGGVFSCIFTTPDPQWAGGDPVMPSTGTVLAYVVTAVNPGGTETHGVAPPQTLEPAGCP